MDDLHGTAVMRRYSFLFVAVALLVVASCGSYKNPPNAKSLTTTRPASSNPFPVSPTTVPGSTTTNTTTRPPLSQPQSLPRTTGRLAIIDGQGRLVVTGSNGSPVTPVALSTTGDIASPTWSPDSTRLVWTATSPISSQILSTFVMTGATAVSFPITDAAPTYFAWTPPRARPNPSGPTTTVTPGSSTSVVYSSVSANATVMGTLTLSTGATARTLASAPTLSWWLAPDGMRAIAHRGNDLLVIDVKTGATNVLAVKAGNFSAPVWLENNLVLVATTVGTTQYLSTVDVTTGARSDLLRFEGSIDFVVSPNGQTIAYQVSPGGGRSASPARFPLEQQTAPTTTIPTAQIARLSLYSRKDGTNRTIVDDVAQAFTWSPTSDRLAFLVQSTGGMLWRFWTERGIDSAVVYTPSDASLKQLQIFPQAELGTRYFSPDGKAFVFAGKVADLDGIWIQPLVDPGAFPVSPAKISDGTFAVWSPQ